MNKAYFSGRLRQYRQSKGWSQQEMADMLAVWLDRPITKSYYQKLEQGAKPATQELALELSRFTKIRTAELVVRK